ncbi:MAG: cysteine desulfurase [Verrucomicrobia bacterium]|nr:cysteine desulfurase [Verrucomicrobiota bacterium]
MQRIFLDNNSTTALDPRVLQAMLEDLSGPPANPSSVHFFGQRARSLLSKARQTTASFFQVKPEEVLFTSGGTEAISLMLQGLPQKGHIITTAIEHSSVYKSIQALSGYTVDYIPCGLWGAPDPELIEKAIRPETKALIFSLSNGETGVKIDLGAIAAIAEKHKIPLLLDAIAYIGKEPFQMPQGATAVAIAAHKFHGPKGAGALIARSSFKISPLFAGGGQEFQRRAGTENLASILGLAKALEILKESQTEITEKLLALRTHLEAGLLSALPDAIINGQGPRVSNTLNVALPGIEGESLLMHLDLAGISVSHGSACSSGALEPSRVLTQMGIDRKIARSSIRISLSRLNTREEIDTFLEKISLIVNKFRKSMVF